MSDDLVAKMRQAADTVIANNTSDDQPLKSSLSTSDSQDAESPADETESVEAAADDAAPEPQEEATEEDAPEEAKAEDEDLFIIRKQAERRVAKAETKAKEFQAKLEEALAQNDKTKQQVAEDIFKKLRRKPISTFKEFGLEFQDLIDAGLREMNGSDDRVVSEIDELRAELRELKEERKAVKDREEEQSVQRQYQEARNQFLDMVTKKDFPTLYNMFEDDPDALWTEAQRVAERIAGEDEDVDDLDVIKMLEDKYRTRLRKLGGAVPVAAKKPAAKTLTTKAASEVRTTGKPFGQLSADEQKDALKAAVKKALNQSPN